MSKMIPQRTIDAIRDHQDLSVELYGIDCTLYLANNLNSVDFANIYDINQEPTYSDAISTQVWIEWSPSAKRLHRLGLYNEEEIPILAHFVGLPDDSNDIPMKSYFQVSMQYIPIQTDTDKFEIVDVLTGPTHDALLSKVYKIAPYREK